MIRLQDPKMAETALANAGSVEGIFSVLESLLTEELVKQIGGVFQFDVKGNHIHKWTNVILIDRNDYHTYKYIYALNIFHVHVSRN